MKEKDVAGNLLPIREINGFPTVSSRLIAKNLNVEHSSFIRLINNHLSVIERDYERVGFEIIPLETKGGMQNIKVANLTEGQALFITTLSKNSQQAVDLKSKIVKSFLYFRETAHNQNTQIVQLTSAMTALAEMMKTGLGNVNERLEKLERKVVLKPVKEGNYDYTNVIDAKHISYDFVKVGGNNVRRIIVDEKIYYSINDINQAIGSNTESFQVARKLNRGGMNLAVKIWIFGNTHPAWFTTKRGLELIISGSRKLKATGEVIECEL